MNSTTELRASSGSEKNDRGRAGRRRQILRLGVTLGLALATVASAQTYTVLKNFNGGSDGRNPWGDLALAGRTLYGTAGSGNSSGNGVVFKVNTDGSGYAVLKSFLGSDGDQLYAGLVLGGSTLYGTTGYGDTGNCGVVFKVNTDGSGFAVLKSFTGDDGGTAYAGLVLTGSTLYGTTCGGGSSGNGVVFKMNTDGSGYAVLKTFTGSDGDYPVAGLVLAGSTLYGTTYGGGSWAHGVVFSLAGIPVTPPSITKPPLTQTAEAGTAPWFSVGVTNTPPEGTYYQWYFTGTNALDNATNAFLRLTNVQPAQVGAYTVVVTNLLGAVTSAPALLSVIPPVDRSVVPAVHLPGGTGGVLHLEYADSLAASQWSPLSDVTLSGGPQLCFDLSEQLPAQRFYRTWQTNGPQPALDMSLATEIPLTGAVGRSVRVDYINAIGPTDAWVTLDTVLLTSTTRLYFDVTAFRQPTRLYRLVVVP